ncbi:MAG TPA: hypothetical protein PK919_12390 [Candidatus Aminicenantes bacterium]|nr:hypothetical protein [Candidatus Aminicenantes bacterium]
MSAGAGTGKRALAAAAALLLVLGAALPARGRELSRYEETVTLAADGSARVRVLLEPRPGAAAPVLIPVRSAILRDVRAKGAGSPAPRSVARGNGQFLEIVLPPAPEAGAAGTIEVTYAMDGYFKAGGRPGPFGNRRLDYRFVSVSFAAIDRFSASLVLPQGWVFNAIGRFVPAPEKEGMVAPFTIVRAGQRLAGRIGLSGLGLGDEVALSCTVRHGRRSPWLIFLLAALAAAYLVFFRDVLRGKGA